MAHNVQGFALGQSEITNYSTLGSVAANCFLKATLPARPSAKPLVGGSNTGHRSYNCLVTYSIDQSGRRLLIKRRLLLIGKFNQRKLLLEIIAANVQGFLLCWYSVLLLPGTVGDQR